MKNFHRSGGGGKDGQKPGGHGKPGGHMRPRHGKGPPGGPR
jgi:hypothetical protein